MPPRCSEHHQPSRPRDGFFHQSLPRPDHEDVLLRLSSDPSGGLGTSGSWRAPGHQGQAHQGARTKKRAMCRQNKVSPPISHRPGGRKGYEGGSPHNALFSTRFVPPSYPRPSTAPTAKLQNSTINVHDIGWRRARQQRRRFSEQRGFQDSHPCFGGPQNPVTGPGETSEASLPSSNMAVTAFPDTGTRVQTHVAFPSWTNCPAAPAAHNVRSVGGRQGISMGQTDRVTPITTTSSDR